MRPSVILPLNHLNTAYSCVRLLISVHSWKIFIYSGGSSCLVMGSQMKIMTLHPLTKQLTVLFLSLPFFGLGYFPTINIVLLLTLSSTLNFPALKFSQPSLPLFSLSSVLQVFLFLQIFLNFAFLKLLARSHIPNDKRLLSNSDESQLNRTATVWKHAALPWW